MDHHKVKPPLDFPQFSQLPTEIRFMIWKQCLPQRVSEVDRLYYNEGLPTSQICNTWRMMVRNATMPMIGSVCQEARQVAKQYGHFQQFDDQYGPTIPMWVQPQLDTLHLNWTRLRYVAFGCFDEEGPLWSFYDEAAAKNMATTSFLGCIITDFPVLDRSIVPFLTPYVSTDEVVNDRNLEAVDIAEFIPPGSHIYTVLTSISIHIPYSKGRRSGLFGLLGDAPIQTVSYTDEKQLRTYEALMQECLLDETDPAAIKEMTHVRSDDFRLQVEEWKRAAEWLLLAHMWRRDLLSGKLCAEKAGLVWKPPKTITKGEITAIFMLHAAFNEDDPWVQEARTRLVKIEPLVMFRHCLEECNKEKR